MNREPIPALEFKLSNNNMIEPIHILSLGAGVQSSTVALMAAEGEITPMPAFAVFADTGDEPQAVYEWLSKLETMLPFRVKIARNAIPINGKLSDNLFQWDHSQIPAFKINPKTGAPGLGKRQCTKHWKIVPVHRKIREATDTKNKRLEPGFVELWQGISVDEIFRAKESREPWIKHRFPLLEKRMRRGDCVAWLKRRGLEAPRSACIYCPLKKQSEWRKSMAIPEERALILKVDAMLNERGEFLHPSCKPIGAIDLTEEGYAELDLFNNECEGMCGV